MKKNFKVDGFKCDLYKTKSNKRVENFILDLKSYNDGLDWYLGSKCPPVFVFLIEKEKNLIAIEEINKIIQLCEKNEEKNKLLLEESYTDFLNNLNFGESYTDFNFMHKTIDDSRYDLFITNFNIYSPVVDGYDTVFKSCEKFANNIKEMSSFSYSMTDNKNIMNIFYKFFIEKNKDVLENKFNGETYFNEWKETYINKSGICKKDFGLINNTGNENEVLEFLRIFLLNIPKSNDRKVDFSIIPELELAKECIRLSTMKATKKIKI